MVKKRYIQDGYLRRNCERVVQRAKKGFLTIVVVFGPTRTGKTTVTAQMAKDVATSLRVPFGVDEIFFDAEKLLKEARKGKMRRVYQLDEAAFDLLGENWQHHVQKTLLKLFMVAAKYNQTFFICIPHLDKLRDSIINDEHTRGLEVYYNKTTLQKGFFKIYSNSGLRLLYDHLKNKRFAAARSVKPVCRGKFGPNLDFLDLKAYEKKKDQAILGLGKQEDRITWRDTMLYHAVTLYKAKGGKMKDIAAANRTQMTQLSRFMADIKPVIKEKATS